MGQDQSKSQAIGKTASYIPAINSFESNGINDIENKRVLVLGAGCAGLGAAWHLNRSGINVTLYDSGDQLGGHANTINVDGIDIDTGFMVYNSLNYPNLISLFEELGIDGIDTTMGFSVSMDDGKFEWCAETLNGLLATPSNLYNLSFYRMMNDIVRFNIKANELLHLPDNHKLKSLTTAEFIQVNKLSNAFTSYYLIPMTAAIWSASADDILNFPAVTLFSFLNNHLLLQTTGHLNWKTPKNRSKQYVEAIYKELGDKAHINCAIKSVNRITTDSYTFYEVIDATGNKEAFDIVVFACHPDQIIDLLGETITTEELEALSKFHYSNNDTYIHTDIKLMPKSKSAWTSWNYIGQSTNTNNKKPVYVTYWLNKLQHLNHPKDIFVSLNPINLPDPKLTYGMIKYSHPQYTIDSVKAQRTVASLQGINGAYYCGAWMGYGFHEDGLRSGLEVAVAVSGQLEVILPDIKSTYKFIGKSPSSYLSNDVLQIEVYKPYFWVRLALEADLGLARSYIAGEWEIVNTGANSDGLTKFLLLLIDNMPNGKDRRSGGIDAGKLVTAWIGSALNMLWYRLTMDNSISNSRSNIHAHYDLSNDLFLTFLDKEHMMYSCGLFETEYDYVNNKLLFKGSLEDAQTRKIDELLARLEPITPEHILLDIGFGWGGICIRAAQKYGCKVHGITLSTEQLALAQQRVNDKGLQDLITFELIDYRLLAKRIQSLKQKKFDRIVSCEMIEAVGHNHLPDFFETIDILLDVEGIFVMQAITMPDARYQTYHKSADFANTIIFPGGCCPSVGALLNAMALKSTLHLENINNINLHYAETLRQWRYRFNASLPRVLQLGFDDTFIRLWNLYLCYCEAGFQSQAINLQMLTFSRPSNPNLIGKRAYSYNIHSRNGNLV
eukprot:gene18365-24061_t